MKQFCVLVLAIALTQGEVQYNLKKGDAEACGALTRPKYVSDASGTISSPNYPLPYDGNDLCEWHIESLDNDYITLEFLDMQLEYSFGCSVDAVDVYDGSDTTATFISANCEDDRRYLPAPILSSTKDLYVVFHSGANAGQKEGFQIQFQSDTSCVLGELAPMIKNTEGIISSPGYPSDYPNNADCAWTLQAPSGYNVILDIGRVSLDENCGYDYLGVYDGGSTSNARYGMFYHRDDPPPITSSRNLLTVHFKTDDWFQADQQGFNASFVFVPEE